MLRQAAILAASLTLPDPFLQPYTRPDSKAAAAVAAGGSAAGGGADGGAGGADGGGADGSAAAAAAAAAEAEEEAKAAADDVAFFKPRLRHHLAAGRSEPLTTLSVFEEWMRVLNSQGAPRAAQYAHSQHASYKRLSEIESLSRELMQRLRQQRVELDIPLPNAGHCLVGPASAAAPVGDVDGSGGGSSAASSDASRLLMLHSLITCAFAPNFAAGRAHCPAKVVDEIGRHKLAAGRSVYCVVQGGSQGGAHLAQRHLAGALAPCGELSQALISKTRGAARPGASASLQTSAVLNFGSPLGALLCLRMAGMKGSLPVPLDNESHRVVGLARLVAPQYPCRLAFSRRVPLEANHEPNRGGGQQAGGNGGGGGVVGGGVGGAACGGAAAAAAEEEEEAEAAAATVEAVATEVLPVEQNWHSACSVLSEEAPDGGRRYLVAGGWSRAGGHGPSSGEAAAAAAGAGAGAGGGRILGTQAKLVAHSASLLPCKPHGCAEALILALSRFVTLRLAPDGSGAVAAYVADGAGGAGLWLPLPWMLDLVAIEEINALRAALSATLGETPAAQGESAASLQLRIMRLSVAQRPALSASHAAAALAAAAAARPPAHATPEAYPTDMLPPLRIVATPPLAPGGAGEDEAGSGLQHAAPEDVARLMQGGGGGGGGGAASEHEPPGALEQQQGGEEEADLVDWEEEDDEPLELLG